MKKDTVDFRIEGVAGELRMDYDLLCKRLFQDGREVERKGNNFYVTTAGGGREKMKVMRLSPDFGYTAIFRKTKTPLEARLATWQYLLGIMPLALVAAGGFLGAVIGICGTVVIYSAIRTPKNNALAQVAIALGVSALCAAVCFAPVVLMHLLTA